MEDDKIVCSARTLKTGEVRGSMKQCADKKQISYWGQQKADPILVQSQFQVSATPKDKYKHLNLANKYLGRIKRLENDIQFSKDPERVKEAQQELVKSQRLYEEHLNKFTELDKILKSGKAKPPVDSGTKSIKPVPEMHKDKPKKVGRPSTKPKSEEPKKSVGRPRVNPVIAQEDKKPKGRPKKVY